MKKISSFIQKNAKVMASFAMLFSVIAVNSRCVCILSSTENAKRNEAA